MTHNLVANWRQAILRTNKDLFDCIYASHGLDGLSYGILEKWLYSKRNFLKYFEETHYLC